MKVACELLGVSIAVFAHPSLRRAKAAIAKRGQFVAREPMFVHMSMLQAMVPLMLQRPAERHMLMLILAAYTFLLRVPSEALPMAAHRAPDGRVTPVFRIVGRDTVELLLPKRKNRKTPSTIARPCWCSSCPITCPVHVLGAYMNSVPTCVQPFSGISPHEARAGLRSLLAAVGIANAERYWCHDLRRGHAEDLRRGGATLAEILRAGDWKSPAFLAYLDLKQLELDRTCEVHLEDSDADD